jgi:hypothetical protein
MEFFIACTLFCIGAILVSHYFMATVPARKREAKRVKERMDRDIEKHRQQAAETRKRIDAGTRIASSKAPISTGSNRNASMHTHTGISSRRDTAIDDLLNPMNLSSPLNPIYSQPAYESPSRSHSHDCGSRHSSSDSHSHHSSSPSYSCDSGSSSDSGSSNSSD